jgi:hypothetical protein
MPISKLIRAVSPNGGNSKKESGSVLGGLGNLLGD